MTAPDPRVWGCLECGAFVEVLTEKQRCAVCGDGLVTELGGNLTHEKAQALIAWARREATERIESWGTLGGATLGLVLGLVGTLVLQGAATGALLTTLYLIAVGGVVGNLTAVRVHRAVAPRSRLQPTVNPLRRRRLLVAAAAGVTVPLLLGAALALFGGPDLGAFLRHTVASVWSWILG